MLKSEGFTLALFLIFCSLHAAKLKFVEVKLLLNNARIKFHQKNH